MATLTTTPIKTFVSGETVTPAKLNELSQSAVALTAGTIVNADVSANAQILASKLASDSITDAQIKSNAAISHTKLASITAGQILLGSATNVPTATALTGDVTVSNTGVTAIAAGAVVTADIADDAVTPAQLAQPFTLDTAKASTSGTTIDFTGVPSWAKRITVMFSAVSTSPGSSLIQVRLGAVGAGSVTASGYTAFGSTNGANATSTTGFITTYTLAAANRMDGIMQICLLSGSTYTASSVFALSVGNATSAAGSVTLTAAADRLTVTTVNGTDTFDAGSINISYEG